MINFLQKRKKVATLSPTEKRIYTQMVNSTKGNYVLYLEGKTGMGKSAIVRTIADKMDWDFMRFTIPTETEPIKFGEMPHVYIPEGETRSYVDFLPGKWVYNANNTKKDKVVILLDELNRDPTGNIKPALFGVMNERMVGNTKLKPHVIFVATGNMAKDGMNVDEFDGAEGNRLHTMELNISGTEWIEYWGKSNLWKPICEYILANPHKSYIDGSSDNTVDHTKIVTRRNWHSLSNLVMTYYEEEKGEYYETGGDLPKKVTNEILLFLDEHGSDYLKHEYDFFKRYLEQRIKIQPKDVLAGKVTIEELTEYDFSAFQQLFHDTIGIVEEKVLENGELNLKSKKANEGFLTLAKTALTGHSRQELITNFLEVIYKLVSHYSMQTSQKNVATALKLFKNGELESHKNAEKLKDSIHIYYELKQIPEFQEFLDMHKKNAGKE